MPTIIRSVASVVMLTLAAMAGTVSASAETYPSRTIKVVVPFPPGGNPDIAARIIIEGLSKALGQSVIVENKSGANGGIGANSVARADPDGYTLLSANLGVLGINPGVYTRLMYDPTKDFVPISQFVVSPLLLIGSRDGGFNTVAELIAKAKANPGKLSFSSSGNGSASHMAGALFNQMAGTDITHVPYRGTGGAATDVASGMVSMTFGGQGASWSLVTSGRVKPIALSGRTRSPDHPDTPTISESGLTGFEVVDWTGLLAPAGTPRDIVLKLNAEVGKVLRQPEIVKKLAIQGLLPTPGTPEDFAAFIAAEQKKWAEVAQKAGVRID